MRKKKGMYLRVRVTETEKARWAATAARAGVTTSELIRQMLDLAGVLQEKIAAAEKKTAPGLEPPALSPPKRAPIWLEPGR